MTWVAANWYATGSKAVPVGRSLEFDESNAQFLTIFVTDRLRESVSAPHHRSAATLAGWLSVCLLVGVVGCRGRAQQEMYQAKLTQEIRVLEDQLYDADYQNRVLRDELERASNAANDAALKNSDRSAQNSPAKPAPSAKSGPSDIGPIEPSPPNASDASKTDSDPKSTENPFQDDPEPGAAPALGLPQPPAVDETLLPDEPQPLQDPPSPGLQMPSGAAPLPIPDPSNHSESTAPKSPELVPPGDVESLDSPLIEGEVKPPESEPSDPPGRVIIPPGTKTMQFDAPQQAEPLPIPDHLELHDGLSGGHRSEPGSEVDGLYLVVVVEDEEGNSLSLTNYEVDAEMTVVVLDPHDESEDPRVGSWTFTPDEVRKLIHKAPVDGIHVPIAWQDRIPSGDDVIVHIRMTAAEDEMRCQGKLRLEQSVANSHWLPRG
ncbi:hypothetical protein NHH03_01835 [Stieleria sp. TO1_6]|uniref:hypothetical protein n=1 Tax=Stieleria tagensis TaxID=2956795 RepID=UPI00209B3F50|nr:hypothetical protein [Stieleria tagensis]MCO8120461.1 hypothetical protein [Stieleria tagensis]